MRHGTVLIAFGSTFLGSLDSPAVTPTSSTARKANMTICRVISVLPTPCGKKPPSFHRWLTEAVLPASEKPMVRMPAQIRIMPMIAVTLTMENQNSSSPKSFTEIRLAAYSTIVKISAETHCGKSNQYVMYWAAAVTSVMPVTTQNNQYVHPVTKPAK